MTKRIGVGLLAFGILLSFFVYFYATSTSPADISQDDALFLDAGLLDDPLDELLNEGEADIPIDDIETDDPALLNQQSAATVIADSLNTSQVGAVVAAGESGWRDDQEDKTYNKPPYGYAGNVRANGVATGWTYDPDEPKTAISVHAYIDGKAGVGTFIGSTKADKNRSDITEGETSYNHWYSFSIPEKYKDGKAHMLYTYGIDAKGLSAKNNALLKNNPKSFNIPAGYVPSPFSQGDRVKATPTLYVRATPSTSGTKVGTVPPGSLGTIVGGPTKTESTTWWQINWDRKISGWSAQPYLAKATAPGTPSCTLTATPDSITRGQSSTLSWTSANATTGTINQGVGAMTPIASGSKSVSPTVSTLYTATVTGAGGQATCDTNVDVTTGTLSKKGIAMPSKYSYSSNVINQLGVSWYYDWSTDPITGATPEFVPMIWGQTNGASNALSQWEGGPKLPFLLTYNEPDKPDGSNYMTPLQAADPVWWNRFEGVAKRISSPVTVVKGVDTWLKEFMTEAALKSDRIDFISLHWYGPPDKVQDFLTFVDRVHNDPAFGGRPIWVTEFSVRCQGSYTLNPNTCGVQHVIDFINTALAGLEARNYVERYSWFAGEGNDPDWFSTARLFDLTTGQLTEVGKAYRDFRTVATFSPGDRVKTTARLNVRATPSGSGTLIGTVPLGSLGTIVGGPTKTANYTFWQIDWDRGISGWSVERYLAKTSTSTDT